MGNATQTPADQKAGSSATTGHAKTPGKQSLTELDSPLEKSGRIFASNNPEGITSGGILASVSNVAPNTRADPLTLYVHHSNHMTEKSIDLFLVAKPHGSSSVRTIKLSGQSASSNYEKLDGNHMATDPNMIVAKASLAATPPIVKQLTNISGSAAIPLGSIEPHRGGEPRLFDGRFAVELSDAADLEVVAEERAGAQPAAAESTLADNASQRAAGNTKVQVNGSSGRASGLYDGARMESKDVVRVSTLPAERQLTGGSYQSKKTTLTPDQLSPKLIGTNSIAATTEVPPAAIALANSGQYDQAAALILEQVFGMSKQWLGEEKLDKAQRKHILWNGSKFDLATPDVPDYVSLIEKLTSSLTVDSENARAHGSGYKFTKAVIDTHQTIGANGDYASYGSMISATFQIYNDTKLAHAQAPVVETLFHTATTFRGQLRVNGKTLVDIEDDADNHKQEATRIDVAKVEPGAPHTVAIEYESPGQISAGQTVEIRKQGS